MSPCLSSFNNCLEASCQPCFAALSHNDNRRSHNRQRHQHPRPRREDLSFDFYDDWEQDEAEWGNDELDRLLSGDGDPRGQQPRKHGGMNYGSRGLGPKRIKGGEDDPHVVPKSSMFGFLESLPWKIGGRGVRYRPSVADLQENVGRRSNEAEPLISDPDDGRSRHKRNRSDTVGSKSTTNSLSSRGDLFPSEDEDDAVPLDDEFAMVLERRTTGATSDDHSSRKKGKKRPSGSRSSTNTGSNRGIKSEIRRSSTSSTKGIDKVDTEDDDIPSLSELKQEEERIRREEESRVEEQRQAAQRLALERGLGSPRQDDEDVSIDLYTCGSCG